jgi:hypothetical protein
MTYLDYADQLILAVGTPGLIRIAMAYRLDPRELISRYWTRGQREAMQFMTSADASKDLSGLMIQFPSCDCGGRLCAPHCGAGE